MKTNYHTHTPRCRHALGENAAEYAMSAYKAGLEVLGFSEHCPFSDRDLGYRMPYEELPDYINEIQDLIKNYKNKMKIHMGLEVEYLPDCDKEENSFYKYLLNDLKMEYLLLGEHFFEAQDGVVYNIYNIPGPEKIVDYALACKKAMSTGYFKVIAHPDIFGVNDYEWDENMEKASDIIIEAALEYDVILEYNANGYRRGIQSYKSGERLMYPLKKFWEKVSRTDAKVVIGSDSHNPKEIWDSAMWKAQEDLALLGIRFIETIL